VTPPAGSAGLNHYLGWSEDRTPKGIGDFLSLFSYYLSFPRWSEDRTPKGIGDPLVLKALDDSTAGGQKTERRKALVT